MRSRNIIVKDDGTFTIACGTFLGGIFKEATEYAAAMNEQNGGDLELVYRERGIVVKIRANSSHELLLRDWLRAEKGFIKEVGPYPKARLSPEELDSDARKARESGLPTYPEW